MSGETNTREYRQQVIVSLLTQLHEGKSVEEVRAQFAEAFDGVSAAEISEAEQALIDGGMAVEEITRLCDIHASVFKGSITEIHAADLDPSQAPGHPVHTMKAENRAFEALITGPMAEHLAALTAAHEAGDQASMEDAADELAADLAELRTIDRHYSRKENVFFPYLEKHGIDAPPKVMWAVDDDIRSLLKTALAKAEDFDGNAEGLANTINFATEKLNEMIFKEDNILAPMMLENFTDEEWAVAASESGTIGYALIEEPPAWQPTPRTSTAAPEAGAPVKAVTAAVLAAHANDGASAPQPAAEPAPAVPAGEVRLPSGVFTVEQLTAVLNALPIDMTFVDANDQVAFFSENAHRIFARTRAIIGREVINCHPPQSMHVVQDILDDFRSGKKESEDFWIKMGGMYIYIRYFAVRGANGEYLGTLEVSQEISGIQALTGEKRLAGEA